jgi:hypothetical protein
MLLKCSGDEPNEVPDMLQPVQLNGPVKAASQGYEATCVVRDDDAVFCWGRRIVMRVARHSRVSAGNCANGTCGYGDSTTEYPGVFDPMPPPATLVWVY